MEDRYHNQTNIWMERAVRLDDSWIAHSDGEDWPYGFGVDCPDANHGILRRDAASAPL